MIDLNNINKIYIIPGATDLRMGIDSFAYIVENVYNLNVFSNSLFMFCNKNHNKLKILHYENDGYWMYYKRLEKGNNFKWPKNTSTISIDFRQLRWLLEGLKIEQKANKICALTKAG